MSPTQRVAHGGIADRIEECGGRRLAIHRGHSPRRAGKHNVTAGAAATTGERYCSIAGSAVTARSGRRGAGHAIRRCHSPSLAGKHHPAASATLRYLVVPRSDRNGLGQAQSSLTQGCHANGSGFMAAARRPDMLNLTGICFSRSNLLRLRFNLPQPGVSSIPAAPHRQACSPSRSPFTPKKCRPSASRNLNGRKDRWDGRSVVLHQRG